MDSTNKRKFIPVETTHYIWYNESHLGLIKVDVLGKPVTLPGIVINDVLIDWSVMCTVLWCLLCNVYCTVIFIKYILYRKESKGRYVKDVVLIPFKFEQNSQCFAAPLDTCDHG